MKLAKSVRVRILALESFLAVDPLHREQAGWGWLPHCHLGVLVVTVVKYRLETGSRALMPAL